MKIEKGKAELELLKSQINPHFLFNTLNNLYGLIVEKSDEAPEVVLKLSDMLRYTIYEGKEEFVFLKNEIVYLENYIALHKIRYQKNVDIFFNHKTEKDLKKLFPTERWNKLHLQIIFYGREFCSAWSCDGTICEICTTCYPKRKKPFKAKKS